MLFSRRINTLFPPGNFIWLGIGTALLYWVLESFIHVLFFDGNRFTAELLTPDIHEIWKRILVVSLLIMFGIFAEQYFILRRRSENALKQAYIELDQIFQTASVGMRVIDRNFDVAKINKTFAVMANVKEADAVNRKCYEIFSGSMCHTSDCPIVQILGGESHCETNVNKTRTDGKIIPCILTATPFIGPDGEVAGIVESFRDITQLQDAHQIIHSERDKLHSILSHLQEGVSIVGTDYSIEYQNDILIKDFGDCKGRTCFLIFRGKSSPCSPCLMRTAIQSGKSQHIEYETRDGRTFEQTYTRISDIDGKDKAIAILRDITAKKNSLAAAMHADRLVAVGELAAGVAHEINNPINGIINYAQIISNKSDKGAIVNDVAERVIKEGNRIARIVESLLTFSRRQHEGKMIVGVKDILSETLTLTTAQMRQDSIILTVKQAEDLPNVLVQSHEIEQVFINIISNACYALKQKYPQPHNDKLLEITTEQIFADDCRYVRISFLDHGTGIPEVIIDKVKNPFFSTKVEGKRTGLGLSISHGIVDNHGGKLTINSQEGIFTRIDVDLPAWLDKQPPGEVV